MPRLLPSLFSGTDPFGGEMVRQMERMFDDFTRRMPAMREGLAMPEGIVSPRIDIAESEDAIELTAELPGIEEKDIELTLNEGVLRLRGEKKLERESREKDWHLTERATGSFARAFPLGFTPAADGVEATFERGVLKVRIAKPKNGDRGPGRIEIKPAG